MDEPWVFYPHGPDWRWRSWKQVADQVARGAAQLGDLPPGSRVGFHARPTPDALAADLAIQTAGLVAVPIAAPQAAAARQAAIHHHCTRWLTTPEAPLPASLPVAWEDVALEDGALPAVRPPWARGAWQEVAPPAAPAALVAAWQDQPCLLPAAALAAAVEALASQVPSAPIRHVLLTASGLDTLSGRLVVAWTLATGAALVVEAEPERLPASLQWTRSTLVEVGAGDLSAVAKAAARIKPRWQRLRAVLTAAEQPAAPAGLPILSLAPILADLFDRGDILIDRGDTMP